MSEFCVVHEYRTRALEGSVLRTLVAGISGPPASSEEVTGSA